MAAALSRCHPARLLEAACNLTEFEDSPGPPHTLAPAWSATASKRTCDGLAMGKLLSPLTPQPPQQGHGQVQHVPGVQTSTGAYKVPGGPPVNAVVALHSTRP